MAGVPTRFRFTATVRTATSARWRSAPGATVRFAGQSARTDQTGGASVLATLHGAGRRVAAALVLRGRVLARAVVTTRR
jgi:hypothetical protein